MKNREEILRRIYKASFIYPNLREVFFEDWRYVATLLEENKEESISLEILHCVDVWLDEEFNLTF